MREALPASGDLYSISITRVRGTRRATTLYLRRLAMPRRTSSSSGGARSSLGDKPIRPLNSPIREEMSPGRGAANSGSFVS